MEASRVRRLTVGMIDRWRRVIGTGYTLLLTFLLLCPEPESVFGAAGRRIAPEVTPYNVAIHVVVFAALAAIWVWSSGSAGKPRSRWWVGGAILYGVATESLQHFVPNRYVDWQDFVGNTIGCLIGWWMISRR